MNTPTPRQQLLNPPLVALDFPPIIEHETLITLCGVLVRVYVAKDGRQMLLADDVLKVFEPAEGAGVEMA